MKYLSLVLLWHLPSLAQPSMQVEYLIRFNDDYDRGRKERLHDGFLTVKEGRSSFFMKARTPYQSTDENDLHVAGDTAFQVYTDLSKSALWVMETELSGQQYWISDSLYPMQWKMNDTAVKQIGEWQCRKASCHFRGRFYEAWFAPDIPVPAGPWKMGGLPGLIVELEDVQQHMMVKLLKIESVMTEPKRPGKIRYDWPGYVKERKRLMERFTTGARAVATGDCLGCQQTSKVEFFTWESYN